jgi:hypothetical protein
LRLREACGHRLAYLHPLSLREERSCQQAMNGRNGT